VIAPGWLVDHGRLAEGAKKVDILLQIMWPAVGMLVAGGISALFLRWRVLLKTFQSLAASGGGTGDMRLKWVWLGGGASAVLLITVQSAFYGTPVWHSVIAIALSVPLGLVALRVLRERRTGGRSPR
jgi:hypothetical protein